MTTYEWLDTSGLGEGVLAPNQALKLWSNIPAGWTFERAILTFEAHYRISLTTGVSEPTWNPTAVGMILRPFPVDDVPPDFPGSPGHDWVHWQGFNWVKQVTQVADGSLEVSYDAPADGRPIDVNGRRRMEGDLATANGLWVSIGNAATAPMDAITGTREFWVTCSARVLVSH